MNKTVLSDGDDIDNKLDTLSENPRARRRCYLTCRVHRSEGKSPSSVTIMKIRNPAIKVFFRNEN